MTPWLSVIGIGDDGLAGLSPAARILVETAQTLVGGARHLAMVPEGAAERLHWRQPLADTIADIEARGGEAEGARLRHDRHLLAAKMARKHNPDPVPQRVAACQHREPLTPARLDVADRVGKRASP
jgi:hypothetical protein